MKAQKNIQLLIGILVTIFIVISCNGQQAGNSSTPEAQAKAPQVDLQTAVLTNNKEALQQHIAAGSNLNEKEPYGGSTPLITAALFDKPEMAKMLIDAGADLNVQNNDGSTALLTASFFCRPEIVKMLLNKGADKTLRNKYGSTAYDSVITPFSDVKGTYDMLGKMLGPMGLKLDFAYLEKTRPEIATLLK